MTRKKAISRLYRQHSREWDFGWHDPNPEWRAELRELYPADFVAAHHRGDVPPSMLNDHARRVMKFNREIAS